MPRGWGDVWPTGDCGDVCNESAESHGQIMPCIKSVDSLHTSLFGYFRPQVWLADGALRSIPAYGKMRKNAGQVPILAYSWLNQLGFLAEIGTCPALFRFILALAKLQDQVIGFGTEDLVRADDDGLAVVDVRLVAFEPIWS